jgi:hypothetical protein
MIRGWNTRHGNAKTNRRHLRAIEEVGTKESDRDEEIEKEDEKDTDDLCGIIGMGERCRNQHAASHSTSAHHQSDATTKSVDGEGGYKAREELPCKCTTGENPGILSIQP